MLALKMKYLPVQTSLAKSFQQMILKRLRAYLSIEGLRQEELHMHRSRAVRDKKLTTKVFQRPLLSRMTVTRQFGQTSISVIGLAKRTFSLSAVACALNALLAR